MIFAWLLSCSCLDDRPPAIAGPEARTIDLYGVPFAELEVPGDSRPDHAAPPDRIPLDGDWDGGGASGGRRKWSTPVPIRPRGLFFHRPTAGMRLLDAEGEVVPYRRHDGSGREWSFDRQELTVALPEGDGEPAGYTLEYAMATTREARLNQRFSGMPPERFVWAEIQDDQDSRGGLLLPAPGIAAWDVTVPPSAELSFVPGLVEPEIRQGPASDGADLVVEAIAAGKTEVLWTGRLAVRAFRQERVDLSRFAGTPIRLRFRTEPGATAVYDYAFLGEPVIASRKADPVRVVLVFIDTLRPDHMSLYGYERDTTAAIDGLAADSVVFTNAHTVAPWTLPSARTLVTGRYPDRYEHTPTLQHLLARQGYATAFFAGNVYLSANFGMNRDWQLHRTGGMWPLAGETTDQALAWLEEREGRDALLLVHYMSPHLPYVEPRSYRRRYAGDAPSALPDEFELGDVRRAHPEQDPALQQYILDRYDNNVRYATDQMARLVAELDDNDILVMFSDHGEEFWDHTGFEHGHSLFEELMHVPLLIRAPGVDARRTDVPVSLVDLAPTVLELAGQPVPPGLDGRSLAPLLRGDAGAEAPLRTRPIGMGHPLYGMERWGVLHEGKKWTAFEGREALYDLVADPEERSNLLLEDPHDQGAPYRDHLAEALGREVAVGYRLVGTSSRGPTKGGLWALCTVEGGFANAWKGNDPLQNSDATVRTLDDPAEIGSLLARYQVPEHAVGPADGAVEICWHPGRLGAREVYLLPRRPLDEVGRTMVCSGFQGDASGGKRGTLRFPDRRERDLGAVRLPLGRLTWDNRHLLWQYGIGVPPDAATVPVDGADPELALMLEKLGYTDPGAQQVEVPDGDALPEAVCTPPAVKLQDIVPDKLVP